MSPKVIWDVVHAAAAHAGIDKWLHTICGAPAHASAANIPLASDGRITWRGPVL
jgi:hypothetical protein